LASCDLGSYDGFREELNRSYGLVAERLFDRSADLVNLSNDALARRHVLPAGPALIEPLNEDPREHPDNPPQKIRHPHNVRILPPSRDFH
jgi:error-prone DNA polymerase